MTALTTLFLRAQTSAGRLAATAAGGLVLVLLALAVRIGDGGADEARALLDVAGTTLLVPVVAVVFATAMLGDPAEDGTIAYLLTTRVARWRLALPAYVAAVGVVLPAVVTPVAIGLAINGVEARPALATVAAVTVGAVTYSALFLPVGLATRRPLLLGLLYVAIWEGLVAGVGEGLARLSVRQYVASLAAWIEGSDVPLRGVTGPAALVVLGSIVIVGLIATTWLLRRHVTRS